MKRLILNGALFYAVVATTSAEAALTDNRQIQLKFRNFYLDREYDTTPARNLGSWSQGITLDAKSGYFDLGSLQLGVDVLAQYAFRLNGRDRNADWILPYDGLSGSGNGKQATHFGKIGATFKAKISQTELKLGEILPITPVVTIDPSRQLLTTYNGVWVESKELKNTKITLGYLDSINARYENQPMDFGLWPKPLNREGKTDGLYVAGIDHTVSEHWLLNYFYGNVTNIYQQNFIGINYKNTFDTLKLDSHVRYFDNRESGDALYGSIDSKALSFGSILSAQGHTVGLSYQQMFGQHGENSSIATGSPNFPTLAGWVPQPYLDNWSVASFIRKDEKSIGLFYSYDFKYLGMTGLKATAKYWYGWNADTAYESAKLTGRGKEQEFNWIVHYTVPEGKLKGLGFQWMWINVDFDNIAGQPSDLTENRIATTYTFSF